MSASPVSSLTQASYSAHAPSVSTCDSEIGGQAPTPSSAMVKEKARPAR